MRKQHDILNFSARRFSTIQRPDDTDEDQESEELDVREFSEIFNCARGA